MRAVRLWLPLAVIGVGVIIILVTRDEDGLQGGGLMISAGLSIWLLNLLYRMGVKGDSERDEESTARAYFDRHGRWPDDPPG